MYRPLYIKAKAICFTWDLLTNILIEEIENILDEEIEGNARMDDSDYWAFKAVGKGVSLEKVKNILDDLNAPADIIENCLPIPEERGEYTKELSKDVCDMLLERHLGYRWKCQHITEDSLWILGDIKEDSQNA